MQKRTALRLFLLVFLLPLLNVKALCQRTGGDPIAIDIQASAEHRWLNKPVLESRSLDQMEDLKNWSSFTTSGGAIVDARKVMKIVDSNVSVATIGLSKEQVHQGDWSLLMSTPTRLPGPGPATGRGWGRSGIRRHFDGEDWTGYNRISFWIYPDLPGFFTTALDLQLYNEGQEKLPALFGQEGETSLILRNHEWNHVVWEIGNVARDKITGFEASYGLSGSAPGEADSIRFFFDDLTLQRVVPDKIEGWDVWSNRIAYSQDGYQTGAPKSAIANGLAAKTFQVIDAQDGRVVLTKALSKATSAIGDFNVMDFSELRTPGRYVLSAGDVKTQPFSVDANVWEESIRKVLNFFYMERCGMEVPGVHGVCHGDWTCVHGEKRIVINGGWHDAGDLSQQAEATDEITYALFTLAENLHARAGNQELYDRVLAEARWGLDWVLKTSFGDGYRDVGSINSRRTDGVMGNDDDITVTARNNPMTNFEAAAVEAIAYRVLKDVDARLAAYALQMARMDWRFAIEGLPGIVKTSNLFRGNFDSDNVEDELPSVVIQAAIDLWRATGDRQFEGKAVAMAKYITGAQQRVRPDWDVPLTGFFYTSTAKDRLLHYCHRGRDQAPMLALTALCRAFPGHADWMTWYSAAALYSEYLKTTAAYTGPYGLLPATIYADTEYLHVPESRMESYRKQVLNGIPLGQGHYLRLFPVWMDYRGHFGTILPQAQALAAAGFLRNDQASVDLAVHQLEWILGKNPFAESTMYGEGHDFVPLYSPSSGQMAGGLPVGIETKGEEDVPYWPVQSMWTYKEIWGHPATNWLWLLSAVGGPAFVEGQADSVVYFISSSDTVVVQRQKHFAIKLPEGRYRVRSAGLEEERVFLPGGAYALDMRVDSLLDMKVVSSAASGGAVTIRVAVRGKGTHRVTVRADGIIFPNVTREVYLKDGVETTVEFRGKPVSAKEPWVVLVVPDGHWEAGKEVRGE
ncbi:glycoside hydrolase family 9 protein [Dinghuibacter silviterrae]|uniref:Cellulase-like Ig domain-containing protein n=1 Tax=Dinghuibacter silviterrae TaxID=1539049 RepID=A0A4R8DMP3_9BACT|nr:glycoside hydrolase family 9 protein [Dinghuibacter silviterrae]TDW99271.1 cellulase-like Ig domain-containing protein [Dinghuibacter silviterrae]